MRYLAWRLWLKAWRPARMREEETDRRLRQLGEALACAPCKHDDPEYRQRFLQALFDGTYRGDFEDSGGPG